MRISQIGSCAFATPDVGRMVAHYRDVVGLSVYDTRPDGTTYLAIAPGAPALVLHPGEEARLARVGLVLGAGSVIGDVADELRRAGMEPQTATDPEPGVAACVDFHDPEGFAVRLLLEAEFSGSGQVLAREVHQGIEPQKLGHIARRVRDPQASVAFYESVLGFRVSDWIGDFFAFLRCNAEHHGLNFIRAAQPGRLDHYAYHLLDAAQLLRACDQLAAHGVKLIWGVGRHGAGHNLFAYYRDPDGHVVELVAEMDLMLDEGVGSFDPRPWHEDVPQRPKVWDPALGPNQWGIGLPAEMLPS